MARFSFCKSCGLSFRTAIALFTSMIGSPIDLPFAFQDHYKPGRELDGAIGTFYDFGQVVCYGPHLSSRFWAATARVTTAPMRVQTTAAMTEYKLLGIETMFKNVRVYADVEVPLYKNMVGYQLTNAWGRPS